MHFAASDQGGRDRQNERERERDGVERERYKTKI